MSGKKDLGKIKIPRNKNITVKNVIIGLLKVMALKE